MFLWYLPIAGKLGCTFQVFRNLHSVSRVFVSYREQPSMYSNFTLSGYFFFFNGFRFKIIVVDLRALFNWVTLIGIAE